jgi:N-acetylmuramoyl-L-alanine amidase
MNIRSVFNTRLFRRCAASAALVTLTGEMAQAQMPLGTQDLEIVSPPSGGRFLRWQRKAGRTYFIQISTSEAPLQQWTFLPLIEYGPDAEVTFEIAATAPSVFFRLKYTDVPVLPGITPEDTDFDGDGISSQDEIWLTHTDPLNPDTDGDGMNDGWEDSNYLDPNDATGDNGSGGDPDHDGIDNLTESNLGTKPQIHDTDGDGFSDGAERDLGTDPLDDSSRPAAEWVIVTAAPYQNAVTTRKRSVTIPAGKSCVLPVVLVSEEYPYYTGGSSVWNDIVTWRITPAGGQSRSGSLDVNSRHTEWEVAELADISCNGLGPAIVEDGLTLTAPDNAPLEVEIEISATNISDGSLPSTVMVGVLPIEPVEFFPVLLDGDENEIAGSQNPRTDPGQTNGMVEEDPPDNRIAHREMRMRIVDGSILLGRTLTWSMDPLFMPLTGGPAVFRGNWAHAAEGHRDRFESSGHYGAHGFVRASQSSATTELQSDTSGGIPCGSAIRANLPPIGFNKGRLLITIEGIAGDPAKVADIEVPPVIVIDPGHGGVADEEGSDANHAVSPTGILEKNMTLAYGLATKTALEDWATEHDSPARIIMTRDEDENLSGANRAKYAKDNGADVIFIIHFNASDSHTARGTVEVRRTSGNVNSQQDIDSATTIIDAIVGALHGFDSGAYKRDFYPVNSAVASDINLGNINNPYPTRAVYCEVEFIDNAQIDTLLNHSANAATIRTAVAEAAAEAIIQDIRNQP